MVMIDMLDKRRIIVTQVTQTYIQRIIHFLLSTDCQCVKYGYNENYTSIDLKKMRISFHISMSEKTLMSITN